MSSMATCSPATIVPSDDRARIEFKFNVTSKRVGVMCTSSTPESPVRSGRRWEDIEFPDPDIQSGHEIIRILPSHRLGMEDIPVVFAKPILGQSRVFFWVTHINYMKGPISLFLMDMEPGNTGFNLRICVENDTVEDVGVGWVAYPASRKDITSGFRDAPGHDGWSSVSD